MQVASFVALLSVACLPIKGVNGYKLLPEPEESSKLPKVTSLQSTDLETDLTNIAIATNSSAARKRHQVDQQQTHATNANDAAMQHHAHLAQSLLEALKRVHLRLRTAHRSTFAADASYSQVTSSQYTYMHTESSCTSAPIVTAGITFVASFCAILALGWWTRSMDAAEKAMILYNMCNFMGLLGFSIIIPDSYDIAAALGQDAAFSGLLIGVNMAGQLVGEALLWVTLKFKPNAWRQNALQIMMAGLTANTVGAFLCTCIVYASTHGVRAPYVLLLLRMVAGMGTGIFVLFNMISMIHLAHVSTMQSRMSDYFFSNVMGIGLGPLISSAARHGSLSIAPCRGNEFLEASTLVWSVASFSFMLGFVALFSSLETVKDNQMTAVATSTTCVDPTTNASRRRLIFACIAMDGMRCYVLSGLEAASALLFEVEFDWGRRHVGAVIGLTFLTIIPAKTIFAGFQKSVSEGSWIRVTMCQALAGSVLLSHRACTWLQGGEGLSWHCQWTLVLGDVLMFPSLYMSVAVVLTIMQRSLSLNGGVSVNGVAVSINTVITLDTMVREIGRFCGPWVARSLIQQEGQDIYALEQVIWSLVFMIMAEVFIVPCADQGSA